jgi:hypothetical protein
VTHEVRPVSHEPNGGSSCWATTPSNGGVDKISAQQYTPECQERFYRAACAAIEQATRHCRSERERRTAQREAILATMEKHLTAVSRSRTDLSSQGRHA